MRLFLYALSQPRDRTYLQQTDRTVTRSHGAYCTIVKAPPEAPFPAHTRGHTLAAKLNFLCRAYMEGGKKGLRHWV